MPARTACSSLRSRDYNAAALADGVTIHKPFPEQAFRDSAFPMCLCISERVAETWTVAEMGKQGLQRSRPMIDEALERRSLQAGWFARRHPQEAQGKLSS